MNLLKETKHCFRSSEKDAKTLAARAKKARMTKTAYILHKLGLDRPEVLK